AGAVFGYQSSSEEQSIFGEDAWRFQDRLPTLLSRYTLNLPSGWSANHVSFNHSKIEPQVSGNSYTWQLSDLPPIKPEPAMPEVSNLAPRLAVSYVPPSGTSGSLKTFASWTDVSRFLTGLHDPQAVPNDAVATKTMQLTIGAKTELERLKAIGSYV